MRLMDCTVWRVSPWLLTSNWSGVMRLLRMRLASAIAAGTSSAVATPTTM